ncbi:MAG: glycine--tRNA ligase subunit alpha [Candidatus Omnitrophota bacterium]
MYFQDIIHKLNEYWAKEGCAVLQPYDIEVGAGTFHTATFFGSLGPKPHNVAYVQASRRPTDGRYGDNPLRTQFYYQYQVILKPSPKDVQQKYLDSLSFLGLDYKKHDLRFIEDDWESPTLGAWGLGWEVWFDSLEITQFTYMQQIGGIDLEVIPIEITYGLERICMLIQKTTNLFDIKWNKDFTYGDLHIMREKEGSRYNFEEADRKMYLELFSMYEKEALRLLDKEILMPAYECVLKMSHAFNLLDARGAISVVERATFIGRVRSLAKKCAVLYVKKIK